MPPWVGSGCRQTRVATRGAEKIRLGQLADQPQPVRGRQRHRAAPGGSTALAVIRTGSG